MSLFWEEDDESQRGSNRENQLAVIPIIQAKMKAPKSMNTTEKSFIASSFSLYGDVPASARREICRGIQSPYPTVVTVCAA
jgi:hypothetical protein